MNNIESTAQQTVHDGEIVMSRVFKAPRELVFDAFASHDAISRWWGPEGFTTTTESMDFRPGGIWKHTMHGPDGTDFPNFVQYEVIEKPNRLLYRHGANSATEEGSFHVTIHFEEIQGGTLLTMRTKFASNEIRDNNVARYGSIEGGYETLDRLGRLLPEMGTAQGAEAVPQLRLAHVCDAERKHVWNAWTTKEALQHWWGPKGFSWVKCALDVKPGGIFHYCMESPEGHTMWGRFTYLDVREPWLLVYIVSFSDEEGNVTRHPLSETWPLEVLNVVTFNESSGITYLSLQAIPLTTSEDELATFAAANEMVEKGFAATLKQLDAFLSTEKEG